ncbi:MAG: hypothetical protein ABI543_08415 [Ignavibacteria bacterium]
MNNQHYLNCFFVIFSLCFTLFTYSQENYDSWTSVNYNTGDTPSCLTFKPKYDFKLENFLRISVGGNSDIVVKLMNNSTSECIRYVYINGGDTYEIKSIPEGYYYVKIAFGSDWRKSLALGTCFAKFIDNNEYLRGEDILDFNLVKTPYGYEVPFYELKLDVYTTNKNNSFDSEQISEDEFLK